MLKLTTLLTLPILLLACSGHGTSPDTMETATDKPLETGAGVFPANDNTSAAESDAHHTTSQLDICASRIGRAPDELDAEIRTLTGKNNYTITTDADGSDGANIIWDYNGADVICLDSPSATGGLNLIQQVDTGHVLYGSGGSEFIGVVDGGFVFGGGGRDIVGTLERGAFYGGDGDDLIASPADHGLYNGWSYVSTVSNGQQGGVFTGDNGNDHVHVIIDGEFHGGNGFDSVRMLAGGTFYGGDDMDSISDPFGNESGEMTGGDFYGENGNDRADRIFGGSFKGGGGNDLVEIINSASFEGMQGEDTVYALGNAARFSGGAGADTVDSMSSGVYDGGDDIDKLEIYAEGSVINVESVPSCLQSVTRRSKCLVLTPQ